MAKGSSTIDLNALRIAGSGATSYITKIDADGIKVHAVNNVNLNYTQITDRGMEIFKSDGATPNPSAVSVAKFGDIARIGETNSAQVTISSNDFKISESEGKGTIFNCGSGGSSEYISFTENLGNSTYYIPESWPDGMLFYVYIWSDLGQQGSRDDSYELTVGTSTYEYSGASSVRYNATDRSLVWSSEGQSADATLRYTLTTKTPILYYGSILNTPGPFSASFGRGLSATGTNQFVIGEYNDESIGKYFIIGKGTSSTPSNALTVDWNGNVDISGSFRGASEMLTYSSIFSDLDAIRVKNSSSTNIFTVDWNGNVNIASGAKYKINGTSILELIYPIGAIYISTNSTSPATLFGGTWERITGRFLLAATDNGSSGASQAAGNTGGSADIQAHTHSFTQPTVSGGAHSHQTSTYDDNNTAAFVTMSGVTTGITEARVGTGTAGYAPVNSSSSADFARVQNTNSKTHTHTVTGGAVGAVNGLPSGQSTGSSGNMPPYISVYVWKRTA